MDVVGENACFVGSQEAIQQIWNTTEELLEAEIGEDWIASANPNSFILLYLECFAIALSIYFSIFIPITVGNPRIV